MRGSKSRGDRGLNGHGVRGLVGCNAPVGWRVLGRCALISGSSLYAPMAILRLVLSQFSPRLYVGSRSLWYSFVLLVRRVPDGVTGSVFDHVGYKSGTVLVYSYALTGPAALYAPEKFMPKWRQ
jgi:hypothetical protein